MSVNSEKYRGVVSQCHGYNGGLFVLFRIQKAYITVLTLGLLMIYRAATFCLILHVVMKLRVDVILR